MRYRIPGQHRAATFWEIIGLRRPKGRHRKPVPLPKPEPTGYGYVCTRSSLAGASSCHYEEYYD